MIKIAKCTVFVLLVIATGECLATPSWVEGISVLYEKAASSALQLHLANKFQVAAVESRAGKQCSVRLQPRFDLQRYRERYATETLFWEPNSQLPLAKVSAEWVADQLWVQLYFNQAVSCTFQISAGQSDVWVTLRIADSSQLTEIKVQLAKARAALAQGNNSLAISIYQRLLQLQNNPLQQQTQEYLGVAYERARNFAKAKASYESYLQHYPKGEDSERVKQRLQGVTLTLTPNRMVTDTLREPEFGIKKQPWRWFGVLSNSLQTYRSDLGDSDWQTLEESWLTDLNVNGRYRDSDMDAKILLTGSYRQDFANDIDNPERLSNAYGDVFFKQTRQQVRIGRQTTNGEGVLSRYDGLHYSKGLTQRFTVNALWGYPVSSSRDIELNTDTQIYGVSVDYEPVDSDWRSNLFFSEHSQSGRLDRRAVGGEFSYQTRQQSWLAYLDYDIQFSELNTVMLNANWFGKQESHYYLSLDYRRSPVLTLSNALIGQTLTSLDDLADQGLDDGELEEVALDRTAISQTFALGASRRFHPHYRWATDLSFWELTGTDDSLGVAGFAGTDLEANLSLQLIANDLWLDNDLTWLTLRYADLTNSELYSFVVETRLPLNTKWRIRPRLQSYQRQFQMIDGSEFSWKPQVRIEYKPGNHWLFEWELGAEWISLEQNNLKVDRTDYFTYLRADWLF